MDLEDDFERANYNEQPKPLPVDVKSGDAYVASIFVLYNFVLKCNSLATLLFCSTLVMY